MVIFSDMLRWSNSVLNFHGDGGGDDRDSDALVLPTRPLQLQPVLKVLLGVATWSVVICVSHSPQRHSYYYATFGVGRGVGYSQLSGFHFP